MLTMTHVLGNNVAIRVIPENTTEGGICLPEQSKRIFLEVARVLGVGDGEDLQKHTKHLKVGARVLILPGCAKMCPPVPGTEDVYIVDGGTILAIMEESEEACNGEEDDEV